MAKLILTSANSIIEVIEGHLYEVWGEDEKLIVYDQFVRVIVNGHVYDHMHLFYGSFEDEDGFHHPDFGAKAEAEKLAMRIQKAGVIDTKYWHYIGHEKELRKSAEERLEEMWSDVSDHYESYYG